MKKFLLFICSFVFTMSSYSQNEGEKLQIYPISENMAIIFVSPEKSFTELGVKEETLEAYGAVSIQTVNEMLLGAINKFDATFAIAISGIAGPKGGTKNKPVGTVVIGICDNKGHKIVSSWHFKGSRISIQKQAAKHSLKEILKFIKKTLDN